MGQRTPALKDTMTTYCCRAVASDSGNYSCSPTNAESDTVGVHVLEGTGEQSTTEETALVPLVQLLFQRINPLKCT